MSQDLNVTTKVKCVVCELEFEREESLAHQYVEGIRQSDIAPGMCIEHQAATDAGFIHVVEIENLPTGVDPSAYLLAPNYTGRRARIQGAMFTKMYPGAQDSPVHYMYPQAFNRITKFEQQIRKAYSTDPEKLH